MGHRPMHAVVVYGFLLWGGIVMHQPAHAREAMAASPADHLAIVAAVNEIGLAADMRDWPRVRAQFADEVLVDYTSLAGGQPARMSADDLVASWRAFLPGFTVTQHLVGSHRVNAEGKRASVLSQFIATHRLAGATGGELWTLGGHYRHTLRKTGAAWKVDAVTMTCTWQTGNPDLPRLAGEAAKQERKDAPSPHP
jgi:hypothetical protein